MIYNSKINIKVINPLAGKVRGRTLRLAGTSGKLTAVPSDGCKFKGWYDDETDELLHEGTVLHIESWSRRTIRAVFDSVWTQQDFINIDAVDHGMLFMERIGQLKVDSYPGRVDPVGYHDGSTRNFISWGSTPRKTQRTGEFDGELRLSNPAKWGASYERYDDQQQVYDHWDYDPENDQTIKPATTKTITNHGWAVNPSPDANNNTYDMLATARVLDRVGTWYNVTYHTPKTNHRVDYWWYHYLPNYGFYKTQPVDGSTGKLWPFPWIHRRFDQNTMRQHTQDVQNPDTPNMPEFAERTWGAEARDFRINSYYIVQGTTRTSPENTDALMYNSNICYTYWYNANRYDNNSDACWSWMVPNHSNNRLSNFLCYATNGMVVKAYHWANEDVDPYYGYQDSYYERYNRLWSWQADTVGPDPNWSSPVVNSNSYLMHLRESRLVDVRLGGPTGNMEMFNHYGKSVRVLNIGGKSNYSYARGLNQAQARVDSGQMDASNMPIAPVMSNKRGWKNLKYLVSKFEGDSNSPVEIYNWSGLRNTKLEYAYMRGTGTNAHKWLRWADFPKTIKIADVSPLPIPTSNDPMPQETERTVFTLLNSTTIEDKSYYQTQPTSTTTLNIKQI